MKKLLTIVAGSFLLAGVVACSSDNTTEESAQQPIEETEQDQVEEGEDVPNEEEPAEDKTEETPTEKEADSDQKAEGVKQSALPKTKNLDVKVEGAIDQRPAELHVSELGYALYVLEDFQFEAEEPGRDILFSTFDDEFFIRIEPLGSGINLEERKELIKEHATGQMFEDVTVDLSNSKYSMLEEISTDNGKITVMHVGKDVDGQLFAFTIHMPLKEAVEGIGPGFLAMLETVTTQK